MTSADDDGTHQQTGKPSLPEAGQEAGQARSLRPLTGDFYDWIALRRVANGRVAKVDSGWFDGGRPVPGHVADTLVQVLQDGLVALADPGPGGRRQVELTDAGIPRYEWLTQQQQNRWRKITIPPDPIDGAASRKITQFSLGELRSRRDTILEIARRHGVVDVRVFGSVAQGDPHWDTVVDLLVELEPGRSLFDLGELLMDLRDFFEGPVNVVTPAALQERVRTRVLREAVPL